MADAPRYWICSGSFGCRRRRPSGTSQAWKACLPLLERDEMLEWATLCQRNRFVPVCCWHAVAASYVRPSQSSTWPVPSHSRQSTLRQPSHKLKGVTEIRRLASSTRPSASHTRHLRKSGGGGNRTRVPGPFGSSFYARSRTILPLSPPRRGPARPWGNQPGCSRPPGSGPKPGGPACLGCAGPTAAGGAIRTHVAGANFR